MEVQAENAASRLEECTAELQRKYGQNGSKVKNAVHCSPVGGVRNDVDIFFSNEITTSAIFNNCTLCIIKPHVVAAG